MESETKKDKENVYDGCAVLILLVPYLALYSITLLLMWRWNISEPFGVPEIGFFHALGLGSMSTLFMLGLASRDNYTKGLDLALNGIFLMLAVLGLGYLWHVLMLATT